MDKIFTLGGLAVIMSSISLIPQVLSVYQTGNIEGISPTFLLFDAIASIVWITYGMRLGDKATIISSSISLILVAILGMGLYIYRKRKRNQEGQEEDDRFQYGGPMMTRGEPMMSMPSTRQFAGRPKSNAYDSMYNEAEPVGDPADYGGGLFGGAMVSSSMDFSDG